MATDGQGGALYNTLGYSTGMRTVTDCVFIGNQATAGGGAIYTNPTYGGSGAGLVLTVSGSTFTSNAATGGSGGGAVLNAGGTTTLADSTFSENQAGGYGGAILSQGGDLALTNSTLEANTAEVSGGGLDAQSPVTVTLSTFSANLAMSGGGGAIDDYYSEFSVTVGDSILAGDWAPYGPDYSNAVTSIGNNLIGEIDGSYGWVGSDLIGTVADPLNAMLAPLGNYGGPTQTMGLLPGSPAIGAAAVVSGVTTDQRGLIRGGTVDIGAFQTSLVVESTSAANVTTAAGLTLPGAVSLANQFAGETISFDPAVFATQETITLTAQLELSDTTLTTSITGPAAGVIVSGGGTSRVFRVDGGVTASLSGLTITGGKTTGNGGGLYSDGGTTTLSDCTLSGNSAYEGGGLIRQGRHDHADRLHRHQQLRS